MKRIFAFVLAASLAFLGTVLGKDLRLRWDASPSPDVKGYHIWVGTNAGVYFTNYYVEGRLNTNYTVTGLAGGLTYYFMATAINESNIMSEPSNEVTAPIPETPEIQVEDPGYMLETTFEGAIDPAGPWVPLAMYCFETERTNLQFFRATMALH